jgi:SOS response regulatory protein OraA/RecX
METPQYRALMDYAMRALARRAHTVHELETKLKRRPEGTQELTETVLERLEELGLVNDEFYLKNTIENAIRSHSQGYLKVASKLAHKGISIDQTKAVWKELVNTLEVDEKELAKKALAKAHKRFRNVPKEKLYVKRAQFLASRGFSPELVFELAKSEELE